MDASPEASMVQKASQFWHPADNVRGTPISDEDLSEYFLLTRLKRRNMIEFLE